MPPTVVLRCPECDKQIQVPVTLEGKQIRCKDCGHTFKVRTDAGAATGAKPEPKPVKKKEPAKASAPAAVKAKAKSTPAEVKKAPDKKSEEEEDARNPNPYGVEALDQVPRCPHCAGDMEAGDIICLHCGYNTVTRSRPVIIVAVEHTFLDWFLWLTPPILCVFVFFGFIGFIVFLFFFLTPIIDAHKDDWWAFAPRIFQLWGTIFSLFIMFFSMRFALKRFIFHPRPPEKLKKPFTPAG
jgi:DNA-directed RNA polymerase subunit RPC12/RpoP